MLYFSINFFLILGKESQTLGEKIKDIFIFNQAMFSQTDSHVHDVGKKGLIPMPSDKWGVKALGFLGIALLAHQTQLCFACIIPVT